MPRKKQKYYAVAAGRSVGIFSSWAECEKQVKGFGGASFKSFKTKEEAEAFINQGSTPKEKKRKVQNDDDDSPPVASATKPAKIRRLTAAHPCPEDKAKDSSNAESPNAEAIVSALLSPSSETLRIEIEIHYDGGARGNPGPAGSGAQTVIRRHGVDGSEDMGEVVIHSRKFLGSTTNNVAEYHGLLLGLEDALKHLQTMKGQFGGSMNASIAVKGDSDLVTKHMKGIYRCKSPNLVGLHRRAKEKVEEIRRVAPSIQVKYQHVYRAHNGTADGLANEAMDTKRGWTNTRIVKGTSTTVRHV